MKRWVKKSDGHRAITHFLKYPFEIQLLERKQEGKSISSLSLVLGKDHPSHSRNSLIIEEHMLSSAKTYAFSSEFNSLAGILRVVGVGSDF